MTLATGALLIALACNRNAHPVELKTRPMLSNPDITEAVELIRHGGTLGRYSVSSTFYYRGEKVSSNTSTGYAPESREVYNLFHDIALRLPPGPVDSCVFRFIPVDTDGDIGKDMVSPLEIALTPKSLEQYCQRQGYWERWECQSCRNYQGD